MPSPVGRRLWGGGIRLGLKRKLEAYWKLEEASGTRYDSHGNHALTDNNTVTQATGIRGSAGQFTAANSEYLSELDTTGLSLGTSDFTIAAWCYIDSTGANRFIVAKNDGIAAATSEFLLYYDNAATRFKFTVYHSGASTTATADSLGAPSTATWYFIVAAHKNTGDVLSIEANGGAADTVAFTAAPNDTATAFTIGAAANAGSPFNGRIDEVAVWRRVLTAKEIAYLYNGGVGRTYPWS